MVEENNEEKNSGLKPGSWVDSLPLQTRKTIWIASTIVIMLAIVAIWLSSINKIFSQPFSLVPNNQLDSFKKEISDLASTTQQQLNAISTPVQPVQNSATTTASSTVTQNQIDQLIQKIFDEQTADWQIYNNSDYNFQIRYPASIKIDTTTSTDKNLIVTFKSDQGKTLTLKQYSQMEEFFSLPNLRKYFTGPNFYLAVFDEINNSTTDLMLRSIKLSE